jgi:hypothetical protein
VIHSQFTHKIKKWSLLVLPIKLVGSFKPDVFISSSSSSSRLCVSPVEAPTTSRRLSKPPFPPMPLQSRRFCLNRRQFVPASFRPTLGLGILVQEVPLPAKDLCLPPAKDLCLPRTSACQGPLISYFLPKPSNFFLKPPIHSPIRLLFTLLFASLFTLLVTLRPLSLSYSPFWPICLRMRFTS